MTGLIKRLGRMGEALAVKERVIRGALSACACPAADSIAWCLALADADLHVARFLDVAGRRLAWLAVKATIIGHPVEPRIVVVPIRGPPPTCLRDVFTRAMDELMNVVYDMLSALAEPLHVIAACWRMSECYALIPLPRDPPPPLREAVAKSIEYDLPRDVYLGQGLIVRRSDGLEINDYSGRRIVVYGTSLVAQRISSSYSELAARYLVHVRKQTWDTIYADMIAILETLG